jgi:hypothetical protein
VLSATQKRKKAEKIERMQREQSDYVFNGFGDPSDTPKKKEVKVVIEEVVEEPEILDVAAVEDPAVTTELEGAEGVLNGEEAPIEADQEILDVEAVDKPLATLKRVAVENNVVNDGEELIKPIPKRVPVECKAASKCEELIDVDQASTPKRVQAECKSMSEISVGQVIDRESVAVDGFMNPSATPKKVAVMNKAVDEILPADQEIDGFANPIAAVDGFENPTAAAIRAAPVPMRKSIAKKFEARPATSRRLAKKQAESLIRMEDMVDFYLPAGSKRVKGDTGIIFIHGGYLQCSLIR